MGDRGCVLIATGEIVVDSTLDVSGAEGAHDGEAINDWKKAAHGGPGAEGGVEGKAYASCPPPAHRGDGSPGAKDNGFSGKGYGAGFNRRVKGGAGGGGAGHGGAGGATSPSSSGGANGNQCAPMPGGITYGNAELCDLFGGSGGAGGSNDRASSNGGGGGGGGTLALIAGKAVKIGPTGHVLARGGNGAVWDGCGGGGSGGAILLAAPVVKVAAGGSVDASGGTGGTAQGVKEVDVSAGRFNKVSGGGGGGGRIAVYSDEDLGTPGKDQAEPAAPGGFVVAGGQGGELAKAGGSGTWFDGTLPPYVRAAGVGAAADPRKESEASQAWAQLGKASIPFAQAQTKTLAKRLSDFTATHRTTAFYWMHEAEIAAFSAKVESAASTNLVADSSFEDGSRAWNQGGPGLYGGFADAAGAHSGKRIGKIGSPGIVAVQSVPVVTGETYRLSYCWRGWPDDIMAVYVNDAQVLKISKVKMDQWEQKEVVFVAAAEQAVLKFETKGQVELDDVTVVRIAPVAAK